MGATRREARDELRQQVERFEPVLEISPDALIITDVEARVVAWNPAAERLFGYSAEEAVGRNLDDLVAATGELHPDAVAMSERTRTPGASVRAIARRTRKDGNLVDVELLAAPLVVDGRVLGTLGSYRDVTELNRQRRFFEALLEASPQAIVTLDPQDRVTSWNPAAQRLFGYTAEEAIGRDANELVATRADLRTEGEEIDQRASQGQTVRILTRRTRKDGSLVDVDIVGGPITVGGELVAKHAFYHDVTELQEQKRYFQSLLELSPAAIIVTDLESKVVSWNPGAERLFGYPAEEAIGTHLDDLVAARPDLHEEALGYSEAAARGERIQGTAQRTRKDGSLVDVQMFSEPVVVNEKRIGYVVIYHDISEVQQQKRYFESLLEISPTAIAVVDLEARIVSWNPAAERLFGYTADEVVGRVMDDMVASRPDLHEEAAAYSEAAERGELVQALTQRTRRDGSLVDVVLHHAPVTVGGERVGFLVIYHDISEVQQQKRWLESVLRLSPTAIITVDDETKVTSWNPGAERLFGYTADEAAGTHLDDLVANSPEIREEAARYSAAGIAGKDVRLVTRRTRKDGSLIDVELLAAPVLIEGERVGHSVIYHDIGEIQRQRRYYEALVQANPVAIVLMDPDGAVTSWNPAAERLFGYASEEAIGRHIDDLVAIDPSVQVEAEVGTERGMGGELVHMITKRTRKDGTLVDVEVFGAPVIVGGEAVGLYGLYHDIGELQRQKRYYEALVQVSPTAIVQLDPRGTVTAWNPAAERLFGYPAEEAIGRNIDDLVATDASVRAEAEAETERGSRGEHVHAIGKRTRKDGTLVDVELLGAPVIVGGEAVGYYGLYHDIGDLQRAREEAEAATEAKSAFLATMSHEIRTPLNAVIGMTGLLLDTELAPEQRHFAEVIRGSGDALLGVINDILDFSKIEAGRLELEMAPFDLRECLESALELVAPAAADKGLDLAYDLDPDAPRGIVGDLTRLRQILINLLNNAVKFTEEGEVVLTVSSESVPGSERHRLTFAVRDTGIGIPEDRMSRLFESFSQVDASTTRRYGGTGLGLAISRRLVELMRGSMSAESVPGEGSTFRFTIETRPAEVPARAYELTTPAELEGRRVLVVDDNATNRQILARQAESWGMLARTTASPAEALDWVRAGDGFDVAVLDMQMPEMDGLMLADELHRIRADLPLVLLTSLGRTTDVREAAFAAYLTKPIRPSQLFEALTGVLGGSGEPIEGRAAHAGAAERIADRLPLRILVVEDNAVNQQLALLLLQKLGYRADVAANGVEALEALERQPYDAVLMDVEMPEMDGLEATGRIRGMSLAVRPQIVAVTANALQGERERCLQAGMDDYITKPLHLEDLRAALARAARARGADLEPAVDADVLRRLASSLGEGGAVSVHDLIATFADHAPELLATLRRGVEQGDPDEVRTAAHSLKSNAAAFGAAHLAELSRELESAAKSGTLDDGESLVRDIESELERVTAELEAITAELAP